MQPLDCILLLTAFIVCANIMSRDISRRIILYNIVLIGYTTYQIYNL